MANALALPSGSRLLADNAQWTNRVEIRSETSSRLYIVAQHKTNGEWGCSCMGWKRFRHCKHLTKIVPLLCKPEKRQAIGR